MSCPRNIWISLLIQQGKVFIKSSHATPSQLGLKRSNRSSSQSKNWPDPKMPMHGKEFGQKDHLFSSMLASKYVLLISLMQIQMNIVPFGKNLRWIMPCHFRNRIHLATNEKGPHLGMEMVNLPTLDPWPSRALRLDSTIAWTGGSGLPASRCGRTGGASSVSCTTDAFSLPAWRHGRPERSPPPSLPPLRWITYKIYMEKILYVRIKQEETGLCLSFNARLTAENTVSFVLAHVTKVCY
jgi:hypothetical protein